MTMSGVAWALFGTLLLVLAAGVSVGLLALTRRRRVVALVVAGSLVVVGLLGIMAAPMMTADGAGSMMGGTSGAGGRCHGVPRTGAAVDASIAGFAFCPQTLIVRSGEQVTWTNADAAPHTVTSESGAFDSGTLAQRDSWTLPQLRPGTYSYSCRIHPWMRGELRVEA